MEETKKCSKCGEIKSVDEFTGRRNECRKCRSIAYREWELLHLGRYTSEKYLATRRIWMDKNKNKIDQRNKKWKADNPEKMKEAIKRWGKEHPENRRAIQARWVRNHPEQAKAVCKKSRELHPERVVANREKWTSENPDRIKESARKRYLKVSGTPTYKLNHSMRTNINHSLHGRKHGRHWEILVGYNLESLKRHIEKQFKDGMTWENIGKWHIDHRAPVVAFNYSSPEDIDFRRCWELDNIQPMWAKENMKKGGSLVWPK
jgi:hypothetical protein